MTILWQIRLLIGRKINPNTMDMRNLILEIVNDK